MAAENFQIMSEFGGYHNKRDITNFPQGNTAYLVRGSQNVLSTDGDTIAPRGGYSLVGQANNTDLFGITWGFNFPTRRGVEIMLRRWDDNLEIYNDADDTWYELMTGLADGGMDADVYWDTTETLSVLLFVASDDNIYYWSGGTTTFASATVNTITKEGVESWAESGFLINGTTTVIIDGITYTYTGGETTTTLTGVTPDPTLGGHAVGAFVYQGVRTAANQPASGLTNDLLKVLRNQVYVGSTTSQQVFVSQVDNYVDYTFSSPRAVGEGAIFIFDGVLKGIVQQEEAMYFSAGTDQWYQTLFQLSADNALESLTIIRLKTGQQAAAFSQKAIAKAKNRVIFVSQEPTFDQLGRVENITTPDSKPLSDPIKNEFDELDFTECQVTYWRDDYYICVPSESVMLIFNSSKGFWEAPQVLPAGMTTIHNGLLYLHSNAVPETYLMFDGLSDNGNSYISLIALQYRNDGSRYKKKIFDLYYTEGYISAATTIQARLNYNWTGSSGVAQWDIVGSGLPLILQANTGNGGLGHLPLGHTYLGGGTGLDDLPKFRHIQGLTTMPDVWEYQIIYQCASPDQQWELLASGANSTQSPDGNNEIIQ